MTECTLKCWSMPDCASCGLRKAPRGRSVPLAAAGGYCHCDGYENNPQPGHYWPDEEPEKKAAAAKLDLESTAPRPLMTEVLARRERKARR